VLETSEAGLYCAAGGFWVDPWVPVDCAVITHAHSDHARWGSRSYLCASAGEALLRARLQPGSAIQSADYGETLTLGGVRVSLHPAGHILGSAQVRVEYGGEVWVVSGDYKLEPDPTCAPFESVRCHTFVSESTFGLPIFRWPGQQAVLDQVVDWWRANQEAGKASILFAYPLGKAQRVLAGIDGSLGPIFTHGAVEHVNRIYRESGVALAPAQALASAPPGTELSQALILAPPSSHATPWMRRFPRASTAFASGWMRIRGTRRRRSLDRGFVLSDHADWPGLLRAIGESGAENVWVTHGYRAPLVRWLQEHGCNALAVETPFEGEPADSTGDAAAVDEGGTSAAGEAPS